MTGSLTANSRRCTTRVVCAIAFALASNIAERSAAADASRDTRLRFEDYPVAPQAGATPVAPRLDSPRARRFRSVLREEAANGPNFAGRYTIVQWGCGASCIEWAIVDARSGAVRFAPFTVSAPLCGDDQTRCGPSLEFRADSELVVVIGARNERGLGRYAYRWHRGHLALIASEERRPPMP
jgi:hypothetical protein